MPRQIARADGPKWSADGTSTSPGAVYLGASTTRTSRARSNATTAVSPAAGSADARLRRRASIGGPPSHQKDAKLREAYPEAYQRLVIPSSADVPVFGGMDDSSIDHDVESVMPSNTKTTVTSRKPAAPMVNGETQPLRGCGEDKPGILAHISVTHLAQLPSEGKASAGALAW